MQDNAMNRRAQLERDEKAYRDERLKASVLSYPPRWITVGITNLCSNKCTFCSYHSRDAKGTSKVYNLPYQLTMEDFRRIVDMAWEGNVPRLHICGTGEPFLNRHVLEMIDYAASVYGTTSIQTNFHPKIFEQGNFLEEIVRRESKLQYVTTDFLSGNAEEHNRLKEGSSYEGLLSKLRYINDHSAIMLDLHFLLTRLNYGTLVDLIHDLGRRGIRNCYLNVVNLFAYDMNDFTSVDAVYQSEDHAITRVLEEAVKAGAHYGISVMVPAPADSGDWECDVFWQKVQLWPVQGNERERYHENLIPHACRAVVLGELSSLGYLFDFENVMAFWNSERMVAIREGILQGRCPDAECAHCYLCKG